LGGHREDPEDGHLTGGESPMDFDEHREITVDRYIQSTFGLWNALLTVNGVMLSAFSAVYVVQPGAGARILAWLIGCCVASLCVILVNHWAVKRMYSRMAQVVSGSGEELTEQVRKRDHRNAMVVYWVLTLGEWLALGLLAVQVALVAYLVFGVSWAGRAQP
jgi:uncharacterized ion transporter superfamily protein YfcC